MRVTQYKGVLDLLDSVIEAAEYMKAHNSGELCAICAQSLHSVLNTVKDEEDSDELTTMINDAVDCFENEVFDTEDLIELIRSIKEKTAKDIKYRLRVLFVAELGGKWDSMASVYEAFCKRDDCDVDVVLEPIFREVKYTDGSTKREVIYKDWLTPLGIKHILYDHYDMTTIRPDITFFSQPYESCTIPMFWPENMAKYTKVVFLPYYTCLMMNKPHYTSDMFMHFPTEKYSWKIACQSDCMKDCYNKYASNKGKNVIVSGLPKWDYSFNLSQNNTPCPEKWEKIISGKKVFMLNTHFSLVASSLSGRLQGLINIFEGNPNIALIWRTHPMTDTVLKLYAPDRYNVYLDLLKKVQNSSNMLIDDFEDYRYSFVWSDALLSDEISSIVNQYLMLNKPVLFTSGKTDKEFKEQYLDDNLLFDFSRIPFSNTVDQVKSFIKSISQGEDKWSDDRKYLINKYFALSNGGVGQTLTEQIIDLFTDEMI